MVIKLGTLPFEALFTGTSLSVLLLFVCFNWGIMVFFFVCLFVFCFLLYTVFTLHCIRFAIQIVLVPAVQ